MNNVNLTQSQVPNTKLRHYFPMLRTREDILRDIHENPALFSRFYSWTHEQQMQFLDMCTGVKGIKILYDPFIKEVFNPEYAPERLEEFLSVVMKQKVRILKVLPNDSIRLADEVSLIITDIVVELEDHSIANIEIQKIGYRFPGQRCACYSADLLLRQYKRVRGEKNKKFNYKNIHNVYTIVIFEKSVREFHKFPNCYLHSFSQKSDTGLELDLLQKYFFIPLDIFQKNVQNKGIRTKLDAWLTFLTTDNPEMIISLIEKFPQFKVMYQELYDICNNVERVMDMFSKELFELDRNTVEFMIDEMQDELEQQKLQLEDLTKQLSEQNGQIEQKREQLSQLNQQLSQQSEQLFQQSEQLSQQSEQLSQQSEQLSQQNQIISDFEKTKQLMLLLVSDNRISDLQKAMQDAAFQKTLLIEYGLDN